MILATKDTTPPIQKEHRFVLNWMILKQNFTKYTQKDIVHEIGRRQKAGIFT